MRTRIFCWALALTALCGCEEDKPDDNIMGFAPVYVSATQGYDVGKQPAKATKIPGKIYAWGNFLYQVDAGTGIHVINNSNPANATKESFLAVPGCSEIAIRNGFLYTNNYNDLVVLNLNADGAISQRMKNAFPQVVQPVPPQWNVSFECPDPDKGIVVGWERKQLTNPKCRR